jgi:hypothetical protein
VRLRLLRRRVLLCKQAQLESTGPIGWWLCIAEVWAFTWDPNLHSVPMR